jgi:hypothetical protein
MPNLPTPHDSVFRRIFGVPENAGRGLSSCSMTWPAWTARRCATGT